MDIPWFAASSTVVTLNDTNIFAHENPEYPSTVVQPWWTSIINSSKLNATHFEFTDDHKYPSIGKLKPGNDDTIFNVLTVLRRIRQTKGKTKE